MLKQYFARQTGAYSQASIIVNRHNN